MMSTSVFAGWELVGSSNDNRVYVDKSSIQRKGRMAKMWSMIDYFKPQQNNLDKPHASSQTYDEYNCEEQSIRYITILRFSKPSGNGDILLDHTNENEKFSSINPNSVDQLLWKIACGKPR